MVGSARVRRQGAEDGTRAALAAAPHRRGAGEPLSRADGTGARLSRHGVRPARGIRRRMRSEEHTSELQSLTNLVCRLLLEKKKQKHSYQAQRRALKERPQSTDIQNAVDQL